MNESMQMIWDPGTVRVVVYYSNASLDQSLHGKRCGFLDRRSKDKITISYSRIDEAFHTDIKVTCTDFR